ncbi:MAG TPA: HIT family protein [Porticoccaceae bacterium]|nr:HIT family protein [Porticoccaceae bacterium]HIG67982.1 HIT family protein [Porticoccaceae bacterium]HIK80546.1 HIT family protein [Porticoccaceae bacterium]
MFELHPTLELDTVKIGELPLSLLLLSKDANYPWLILVPKRCGIEELYQLSADDRYQLTQESDSLSRALVSLFSPDKLNIAAIGNMVPQLHMHHVCRYRNDACWPKPVWGQVPATAYTNAEIATIIRGVSGQLISCGLTSS